METDKELHLTPKSPSPIPLFEYDETDSALESFGKSGTQGVFDLLMTGLSTFVGKGPKDIIIDQMARAALPEEAEASWLVEGSNKIRQQLKAGMVRGAHKGTWQMPSQGGIIDVAEFSTDDVAKRIESFVRDNKYDLGPKGFSLNVVLKDLKNSSTYKALHPDTAKSVDNTFKRMEASRVKLFSKHEADNITKNDGRTLVFDDPNTLGVNRPGGKNEIRATFNNGIMRTDQDIVDTILHEIQHDFDRTTLDWSFSKEYMDKPSVSYDGDIAEIVANVSASRRYLDSNDVLSIHPLVSITDNGKDFTIDPAYKMIASLVNSGDMNVDMAKNYIGGMKDHLDDLTKSGNFFDYTKGRMHQGTQSARDRINTSVDGIYHKTGEEFYKQVMKYHEINPSAYPGEAVDAIKQITPEAVVKGQVIDEQVAIRAHRDSKQLPEVFNKTSGIPDYDSFYNPTKDFGEYNNVIKETVEMSPQDYIDKTIKGFESQGYKVDDVLTRTEERKLKKLREHISGGGTLNHPTLRYNYTKGGEDTFGQEGWHRAIIAKEMGIEKIPVSIIRKE